MTLNEKDFKLFKKWLTSHLAFGPVTITFTKKDGTERVMECTTNIDLVPQEPIVESTEIKKEKKANDEVMPVYDLEAKGWRSFRWDSVKQVTLKIGEEREFDTAPQ
jgi:hypothetical protein